MLAGIYSLIPYKTPWCAISIQYGLIVIAGIGAATLMQTMHNRYTRLAAYLVLSVLLFSLARQSYRLNFWYHSDARNPWAYVQTVPDIIKCVVRINAISALTPEGTNTLIQVIAPPDEVWPLPWYLRRYPRVGYWESLQQTAVIRDVAILVTSLETAAELLPELEQEYMIEYYGVREDVLLALHIRKDIWSRFLESRK